MKIVAAVLLSILAPLSLAADAPVRASEYAVKAALLMKFAEMVDWPEGAPSRTTQKFNICTIGDDVFGKTIQQSAAGKTIGGRSVAISHVTRADQVRDCAVLYITSTGPSLDAMVRRFARMPILTVGDGDAFTTAGGVIGFRQDAGRVRFVVNEPAAAAAGLRLDAKLIEAAMR